MKIESQNPLKPFSLLGMLLLGLSIFPAQADDVLFQDTGKDKEPVWEAYMNQARKLTNEGNLDEAERLYRSAISEARPSKSDRLASTLYSLAKLYLYQKNEPAKALDVLPECVQEAEKSRGLWSIEAALTHELMADCLIRLSKIDDAELNYKQALKIYSGALGRNDASTLLAYAKLAQLKKTQGQNAEASALIKCIESMPASDKLGCMKDLQKLREVLGAVSGNNSTQKEESPKHFQELNNEGAVKLQEKRFDEAIEKFNAALAQNPGYFPARQNIAIAYQHMAIAHQEKGELTEAESCYLKALRDMVALNGVGRSEVSSIYESLASLYLKMKQPDKAKTIMRSLISLTVGHFGNNSDETLVVLKKYQTFLKTLGGPPNERASLENEIKDLESKREGYRCQRYADRLARRIMKVFKPGTIEPNTGMVYKSTDNKVAVFLITISGTGQLLESGISQRSGDDTLDRRGYSAIKACFPEEPPPGSKPLSLFVSFPEKGWCSVWRK